MAKIIYGDIGPDPTKPTGGGKDYSSRVYYEPLEQWAQNNLVNNLWQNAPAGVDLSNVLGPNWQQSWDGLQGADYSSAFGDSWNTWAQNARAGAQAYSPYVDPSGTHATLPYGPTLEGLNVNQETLQKYFDQAYAGNPNRQYLPTVVTGIDGKPYVRYNDNEKDKGGFLDKITPIAENMMALSGFALAGLSAATIAEGAMAASAAAAADIATGGLGGLEGAAMMGTGSAGLTTSAAPWSLSGAIDKALDPKSLATSAVKNAVGQFVSTGTVSPTGLVSGVVGNAVGGVAGGAVGDATGSGLIGGVAGSLIGGATGSAIKDALTDDPETQGGGTTTGTGTTGSVPVVNDVPMGFDMALAPYQPIYERA